MTKKLLDFKAIGVWLGLAILAYAVGHPVGYLECRAYRNDRPLIASDITADLFDPVCRTAATDYLKEHPDMEKAAIQAFIREAHAKLPNLKARAR